MIVNLSSGSYFAIMMVVAGNTVYHIGLGNGLITKLIAIKSEVTAITMMAGLD